MAQSPAMQRFSQFLMNAFSSLFLALVVTAGKAVAAVPESGFYVDPLRSGLGYAIEVQGDKVGIVLYAHHPDGSPEFYVAGGDLVKRSAAGGNEGAVPADHFFQGTLYRASGGFGLLDRSAFSGDGFPPGYEAVPIGELSFRFFVPTQGSVRIDVTTPVAGIATGGVDRAIIKLGFGLGGIGQSPGLTSNACWHDLRGDWVFAHAGDAGAEPLRLSLDSLTEEPQGADPCQGERAIKTYRDSRRGAELRCVSSSQPADFPDGQPRVQGCELREQGSAQVTLSFWVADVTYSRIVASSGPLQRATPGNYPRGAADIVGVRLR
jgi:hypothetical protein